MAKVMLIMEEPVSCRECPCSCEDYCQKESDIIPDVKTKPEWCPLREVPQKKEMKTFTEFLEEKQDVKVVENFVAEEFMKYGYNACIDEILGDGE